MPRFLVLIPTHDHGELLARAVASLRAQSERDWRLVIVGDGPTTATRTAAEAEAARDPRVRYREFPKSGRTGEPSRHVVLSEADAEFVAYLSDDDLWRRDHLERMAAALAEADFASSCCVRITAGGRAQLFAGDYGRAEFRELWGSARNLVPLSAAAHRLAAYRLLPHGWEATPAGVYTDHHMWRAWAAAPGLHFATAPHLTVFNFRGAERKDWTLAQRAGELDRWLALVSREGASTDSVWLERIACEGVGELHLALGACEAKRKGVADELRAWRGLGPRAHARWALRKLLAQLRRA